MNSVVSSYVHRIMAIGSFASPFHGRRACTPKSMIDTSRAGYVPTATGACGLNLLLPPELLTLLAFKAIV